MIKQDAAQLDKLHDFFKSLVENVSIKINMVILNRVETTKFLGVLVDNKLTWKHHISLLKSKLSKTDVEYIYIYIYSLFSPYIIILYCAEIWGNTYAANLKCLVLLQKKVVRLICGAQRLDHTSSLFYDLCILKLPDMVKLKTAEIMYSV